MNFKQFLLAVGLPMTCACGPSSSTGDAGTSTADTPSTSDTATPTDVPTTPTDVPTTPTDTGTAVPVLVDCAASDYVDRTGGSDDRTVIPRGTTGYTPRCVIIRAGQSVTFSMSFAAHPLTAGVPHGSSVGATTPSPIMTQRSGSSYNVAFPNVGFFPFYCLTHAHVGMAGVVRVIP